MSISILTLKTIFMKYLPPVRPKLILKLKMLRIYWNLAHLIFRTSQSWLWCQRLFLLNIYHLLGRNWSQNYKYTEFIEIWHFHYFRYVDLNFNVKNVFLIKHLPIARPQLVPRWKMLRIYWNLAELIFQICQSQLWCQKWFLLNIYHLLGPNWSQIKSVQNLLKFDAFSISIIPISI